MKTQQIFYPEELRAIVKQVVVIRESDPFPRRHSISYVADGLPGIYFQKSDYAVSLNEEERRLSKLFLYGQTVNPITINTIGAYTVIISIIFSVSCRFLMWTL